MLKLAFLPYQLHVLVEVSSLECKRGEGDNIEWSDKLPEHMVDNL